ncbi:MAG TPA: glycosyltransferase [Ktedonobacteraceae bacterium]|nr:glycosyltransferase [Ktedonobacteraceae bacterium]
MGVMVSVIVPTFRRPALLERCLEALLAQDFAPAAYEILIVDDAACKATRVQIENCARRAAERGSRVYYLSTAGAQGPAVARNLGWRAARGEIIAFTDDDCMPTSGWLSAGVAAFTNEVMAVSGRIRVPVPARPTDYEYDTAHLEQSEFATANCFYRRAALETVGGFDERFTAAWREDSDLFFMVLERGLRHCVAENAVVVHPVRPARWGVSLAQQRKCMFNALLYKKHPVLYRQYIQATPPWQYYCIGGSWLVVLLGIIGQSWTLILAALAFWCLLVGRFCLRRLACTSHAPGHVSEMIITSILIPPLAIFWCLRGMVVFRVPFL